jgi:FAD-dependent urate hydroxylase
MRRAQILVVGAGLGGLALARALGQPGLAPQVIERASGWEMAGTGMYLPANGVRALQALGLEQAVAARAVEIPRQRLLDHRGRLPAEIDLGELWGDIGPCLALSRADLHEVPRDGVPVRLGRTIRSWSGWTGGTGHLQRRRRWRVRPGRRRRRAALHGPAAGRGPSTTVPVGQHSWRFLAACPPQVITWTVMLGRGASFLTVPVGCGQVYCYADITADSATSGDPTQRLRERFAGFAAPVPELLEQLQDSARVHVAPIEQVATAGWGRGAVVLVGDAAHGMSPNMAEGAALAFEDALVLAACLHDAGTVTGALAGFVARRSPRTDWVRAQTHRRDRTRNPPPAMRNLILRAFGRERFTIVIGTCAAAQK